MDCNRYILGVTFTPLFTPSFKEQLSLSVLQLLQDYCDIRNDCANCNPDLFEDEPFATLSIDTMRLDDVKAAIEIQENAREYLMPEENEIFSVAINELRSLLHSHSIEV